MRVCVRDTRERKNAIFISYPSTSVMGGWWFPARPPEGNMRYGYAEGWGTREGKVKLRNMVAEVIIIRREKM